MNPKDRAERVVALDAIANEAEKLAESGADPITVKSFTVGARQELANQKPDIHNYRNASVAAKKAKDSF